MHKFRWKEKNNLNMSYYILNDRTHDLIKTEISK